MSTYTVVLLTDLTEQELADLLVDHVVDFEIHHGRMVGDGETFGDPTDLAEQPPQIPGQTELGQ